MRCDRCDHENADDANFCAHCGYDLGRGEDEDDDEDWDNHEAEYGDATGGLIPYKNPCALIAYYFGLFALIPVIGILLGLAAVVLGIIGLRMRARRPVIRGSVHAWIGIICGGLFSLGQVVIFALMMSR